MPTLKVPKEMSWSLTLVDNFDVTIMRVADHAYDILATDGNSRLGGIDFDKRLVGYIMQELENKGSI